jgi:5-methylcytosine-specific restriction endonuclease McrA
MKCQKESQHRRNNTEAGRQSQRVYRQSKRGRKVREKFMASEKGKVWAMKRKLFYQSEQGKAYLRNYYQTEVGKLSLRSNAAKTRAKRNNIEGSYTPKEWISLKEYFNCRCLRCGRHETELSRPLQQDHVIPVSKGGNNWIDNIQPLCCDCNGMGGKGTKTIDYRS